MKKTTTKEEIAHKFGNLREFCRASGLAYTHVIDVLRGKAEGGMEAVVNAYKTSRPQRKRFTTADRRSMKLHLFKNYGTQSAFIEAHPYYSRTFVNHVLKAKHEWWTPRMWKMLKSVKDKEAANSIIA